MKKSIPHLTATIKSMATIVTIAAITLVPVSCVDADEYDGFDKSLHQHYLDEEACDEPKRSRRKTVAKKASKKSCGDELTEPEIDLNEIHLSSDER